jgi:YHS domain-containing protein
MRSVILMLAAMVSVFAGGVALADKATDAPALGGYCPVAYVAMNQAVKGDPKVSLEHHGRQYLFANADAKKMFEANPSKYEVAYDGLCATAMAMGKELVSDPTIFAVSSGRTYLFSGADAKKMFDADAAGTIAKADKQWATLNPALDGYCPVAYVAMNKAVKGDPKISGDFDGKRYLFANADAKKMFDADPAKYRVAYNGLCATAMAMGKELESDPEIFTVVNGTTYLFSSAEAKKTFEGDRSPTIKKADEQWAKRR